MPGRGRRKDARGDTIGSCILPVAEEREARPPFNSCSSTAWTMRLPSIRTGLLAICSRLPQKNPSRGLEGGTPEDHEDRESGEAVRFRDRRRDSSRPGGATDIHPCTPAAPMPSTAAKSCSMKPQYQRQQQGAQGQHDAQRFESAKFGVGVDGRVGAHGKPVVVICVGDIKHPAAAAVPAAQGRSSDGMWQNAGKPYAWLAPAPPA